MLCQIFTGILPHFRRLFSRRSFLPVNIASYPHGRSTLVGAPQSVEIIPQRHASLGALIYTGLNSLRTLSSIIKSINRSHHINLALLLVSILSTFWARLNMSALFTAGAARLPAHGLVVLLMFLRVRREGS